MKPLKRIHHYLQQRYGAMWSLLLFAMVMLGLIVIQVFGWSANWHSPDADKYLGWMYACNLGCLLLSAGYQRAAAAAGLSSVAEPPHGGDFEYVRDCHLYTDVHS